MRADFERFAALVMLDEELAEMLWAEPDGGRFVDAVTRLAAERSLHVDADDVRAAMAQPRASWSRRYEE